MLGDGEVGSRAGFHLDSFGLCCAFALENATALKLDGKPPLQNATALKFDGKPPLQNATAQKFDGKLKLDGKPRRVNYIYIYAHMHTVLYQRPLMWPTTMTRMTFHTVSCQRRRMIWQSLDHSQVIWQSLDRHVQLVRQDLPTHSTLPLRSSSQIQEPIPSMCLFARRTFLLEGMACSSRGLSSTKAWQRNRTRRVDAQDTVDEPTASATRRVRTCE